MDDWHPEDIKAALRKKGYTLAGVARAMGVSKQSVCLAIAMRASEPAERAVAQALGIPPHQIWPSRYHGTKRIHLVQRRATRAAA